MRRLALVMMSITAFLLGSNTVHAESAWVQSYQRANESTECESQSWETPWQESWGPDSSWKPSWEQWANNGLGGWVYTRSINWAPASSARGYQLGDVGPGGGLVFLISGGLTYEMAPKTWGAAESNEVKWCNNDLNISDANGTAIGTGFTNSEAMVGIPCSSGAGNSAVAYRGGGYTDWFLPSKDELNAMCIYSRNPTSPASASTACTGAQDSTFSASAFGFADGVGADFYWSSSQWDVAPTNNAWLQDFFVGTPVAVPKVGTNRVRPIRSF